jgi:hypothetical protein
VKFSINFKRKIKIMETTNLSSENEIANGVNTLLAAGDFCGRYKGNDNSGKPKTDYLRKMVLMTDQELKKECESKIWLSAYASNNHRSDYHWHCDCCYDECKRRGKEDIYSQAHKHASNGL